MRDEIVDMERDIVTISNRQSGLMEAVPPVFPYICHSQCLPHLAENFYRGTRDNLARKYKWAMEKQIQSSASIE